MSELEIAIAPIRDLTASEIDVVVGGGDNTWLTTLTTLTASSPECTSTTTTTTTTTSAWCPWS